MTKWRQEGENGIGSDGAAIIGTYFCVFDDGIWYRHDPPRSTPWTIYLGVMKRLLRQERAAP